MGQPRSPFTYSQKLIHFIKTSSRTAEYLHVFLGDHFHFYFRSWAGASRCENSYGYGKLGTSCLLVQWISQRGPRYQSACSLCHCVARCCALGGKICLSLGNNSQQPGYLSSQARSSDADIINDWEAQNPSVHDESVSQELK